MAFDKVEVLMASGRKAMPASVSLYSRGVGYPKFIVSFSKWFSDSFGFNAKDRFDLLIGTGDQKGLVRFKRNKAGLLAPCFPGRGHYANFQCGFIERFGTEPEPKEYCNAEVIDADTIEVVLPRWADEVEG